MMFDDLEIQFSLLVSVAAFYSHLQEKKKETSITHFTSEKVIHEIKTKSGGADGYIQCNYLDLETQKI